MWYICLPLLILAAVTSLFTDPARRLVYKVTGKRFFKPRDSEQPSSQTPPSGGQIDASDIVISQHPDGTRVLLGFGSSGKVCPIDPLAHKIVLPENTHQLRGKLNIM